MTDIKRRLTHPPARRRERETDDRESGRVRRMTPSPKNGFISYRYSYRSVTTDGRKTHVTAREQRFRNGKLETEEFEGTTDADAYTNTVSRTHRTMQEMMTRQMEMIFRPFSLFLPGGDEEKKGRR
jgi:hypothetical protein